MVNPLSQLEHVLGQAYNDMAGAANGAIRSVQGGFSAAQKTFAGIGNAEIGAVNTFTKGVVGLGQAEYNAFMGAYHGIQHGITTITGDIQNTIQGIESDINGISQFFSSIPNAINSGFQSASQFFGGVGSSLEGALSGFGKFTAALPELLLIGGALVLVIIYASRSGSSSRSGA
jgi:phage-related protein